MTKLNEYSERCAALAAATNITFELLSPETLPSNTSGKKLASQLLSLMMEMNTNQQSSKISSTLERDEFEDLAIVIKTIAHRFEVIAGEVITKTKIASKVDLGLLLLDSYASNETIKVLKANMVKDAPAR